MVVQMVKSTGTRTLTKRQVVLRTLHLQDVLTCRLRRPSTLQNYLSDWGPEYGNRGCNNPKALAEIQSTLESDPKTAHLGTIAACLGYRWHPQAGDPTPDSQAWQDDEAFFLDEALQGDGWWYGKLMADHTALDWRDAIKQSFGPGSGSTTKTLVVASTRSGCFPAAGPLKVVELANGGTEGGWRGVLQWSGVAIGVTGSSRRSSMSWFLGS